MSRRSIGLAAGISILTLTLRAHPAPPPADVTFAKDVAPILHAHCVTCHRPGEVAPMALRTYEEARPWARSIKQKVVSREMPPWFADPAHGTFANDARLSSSQIGTIARWVDAGAPRGNPAGQPKTPEFTDGWQLGEPDFIIDLPEIDIPAEGKDYFPTPNLTLDIPEDRWVRAVEIRPSNRAVTHHSVLFTTSSPLAGGSFDVLAVWAVGTPPTVYKEGMGRWLRKGQQIRTNLHYHPNGTPGKDRTRVGLYWGRGELKKEVTAALAGDLMFEIPPGAKRHELRAVWVVDQDVSIVSYFPHMHFRGKDMSLTATFPDGRRQTLLSVPKYDFNWQLFYYPKDRVALPRGTRIDILAHYDNSAENRSNPDPTRAVTFGESSNDEMMFGMFEFIADEGVAPKRSTVATRIDALLSTLPRESSYRVNLQLARQTLPSALHLPKQGPGTWYIPTIRQILVVPPERVAWTGDAFEFEMDLRMNRQSAGRYRVSGEAGADGTIRGTVAPIGPTTPLFDSFEGALRK